MDRWGSGAYRAFNIVKFRLGGLEDFVAGITLVGFGWSVTTLTLPNDKPVSQEHCTVRTVKLFDLLLYKEPILIAF